ncbi:MAG TPA: endonuclease/exonuclease/phosphatase family protein, partial [Acidimicrobiales bacterium]
MDLRVVTFNIRNGRAWKDGRNVWWLRRRATVTVLRRLQPDVAGLQEVYRFQLRYLRRRLRGYETVGAGRKDGRKGESCPIAYRSDRLRLERTETRWLSDTPDVPGSRSWGNHFPRIATFGWFTDLANGEPICVINTHLDEAVPEARRRSGDLLLAWIAQEEGVACLLVGDLNAVAGEDAVDNLLAGGLADTLAPMPGDGAGTLTGHAYTDVLDGRRIDYILAGPGWQVREAAIARMKPR